MLAQVYNVYNYGVIYCASETNIIVYIYFIPIKEEKVEQDKGNQELKNKSMKIVILNRVIRVSLISVVQILPYDQFRATKLLKSGLQNH